MGAQASTSLPSELSRTIGESLTIRDASRGSQVNRSIYYSSREVLEFRKRAFDFDSKNKFYKDVIDKYRDPRLFDILYNMYHMEKLKYPVGHYCATTPQNIMLETYLNYIESDAFIDEMDREMVKVIFTVVGNDDFLRYHANDLLYLFDLRVLLNRKDKLIRTGYIYLLAEAYNKEKLAMDEDKSESDKELLNEIIGNMIPYERMLLSFATGDPTLYTGSCILYKELYGIEISIRMISLYIGPLMYGGNVDMLKRVLCEIITRLQADRKEEFLIKVFGTIFSFLFGKERSCLGGNTDDTSTHKLSRIIAMLTSEEVGGSLILLHRRDQIFGQRYISVLFLSTIYYGNDDAQELMDAIGIVHAEVDDTIKVLIQIFRHQDPLPSIKDMKDAGKPYTKSLNRGLTFISLIEGKLFELEVNLYIRDVRRILEIDYDPTLAELIGSLTTIDSMERLDTTMETKYMSEPMLSDNGFANIFKMFTPDQISGELIIKVCSNIHQLKMIEAAGVSIVYGNVLVYRACACADIEMLKYVLEHKKYIPIDDVVEKVILSRNSVPVNFKRYIRELKSNPETV
jgi:hypothetical protein